MKQTYREEFTVKVTIPSSHEHDFGNGLFAKSVRGSSEVAEPYPIPGWGELCLKVRHGHVQLRFDSPVSRVDFSYLAAFGGTTAGRYAYQEFGGGAGGGNLPATPDGPMEMSIESSPGIEFLYFLTDYQSWYDNITWTKL